jgi:hypothetical protein
MRCLEVDRCARRLRLLILLSTLACSACCLCFVQHHCCSAVQVSCSSFSDECMCTAPAVSRCTCKVTLHYHLSLNCQQSSSACDGCALTINCHYIKLHYIVCVFVWLPVLSQGLRLKVRPELQLVRLAQGRVHAHGIAAVLMPHSVQQQPGRAAAAPQTAGVCVCVDLRRTGLHQQLCGLQLAPGRVACCWSARCRGRDAPWVHFVFDGCKWCACG